MPQILSMTFKKVIREVTFHWYCKIINIQTELKIVFLNKTII
jgi:hypothetical protein